MMNLLAVFEQTAFSVWVREEPSIWGFPFILFLHTLGLAMLAGISVGLDVWLLGAKTGPPPALLIGIYRIMWIGFGINLLSGLALLAAYPAKALTNWVFFVKLALVAAALWVLEQTKGELLVAAGPATATLAGRVRRLAALSLLFWAGAIFAGRLLAYTHSILLVSERF
jgi:hypothetical protein